MKLIFIPEMKINANKKERSQPFEGSEVNPNLSRSQSFAQGRSPSNS
ncbi:hypothetical protein OGM63_03300 [Plectonema radiosum NIES-515]|uniref:Uncharacterized protein n=1 Tax=Plectonema radiosum NIES-515 TaxID=2986073 RepID=A0ABT3ATX8_9CYAN|nr:hypothetical protein [Plectonema radiosum]MCV3212568.1 hypothetical protein [Plectonema radiosum NIES-515]